jgi:predicted restriction endonuclease
MHALSNLIGSGLRDLMTMTVQKDEALRDSESAIKWQEHLERQLERDDTLQETDKQQLVLARRGQGVFKKNVRLLEQACRITKVDRLEHLRASHIRPWRDSDNEMRLSGENGLLLTPSVDHLFDRGFISFEDSGRLLISPIADRTSLSRMGIETQANVNVGRFSEEQRKQLEYHRSNVFLAARVNAEYSK